jgi:hypothetical protein
VESGYPATNPYHNSLHVAQVVHRLYMFLIAGGFMEHFIDGNAVTMLSTVLAAVSPVDSINAIVTILI